MHPLYGALLVPYVPVRVTRGAVMLSHIGTRMRLLAAEPLSIAGHLFPGLCLCGTILQPRVRWCGTGGFQEQGQCLFIGLAASSLFV